MTNCDTCQLTRMTNKKYGRLPAKLAEDIPWNKICVGLVGPYVIQINGKKGNLWLKAVTVVDPVTGWFEISQYEYKRAISIANLVEATWISRYPIPIEIMYDQGK